MKSRKMLMYVVAIALTVLIMTGCTNPADHPTVKNAVKDIEALKTQVAEMKSSVDKSQSDNDLMIEEVVKLKKANESSSPEALAKLEQKIAGLEDKIAKLEAELAKKGSAPAPSVSEKSSKSTSASEVSAPAKQEKNAAPKGFYYKVKDGETIDAIAAKYKTTAANIRNDNSLPAKAVLKTNQQIYIIPGK